MAHFRYKDHKFITHLIFNSVRPQKSLSCTICQNYSLWCSNPSGWKIQALQMPQAARRALLVYTPHLLIRWCIQVMTVLNAMMRRWNCHCWPAMCIAKVADKLAFDPKWIVGVEILQKELSRAQTLVWIPTSSSHYMYQLLGASQAPWHEKFHNLYGRYPSKGFWPVKWMFLDNHHDHHRHQNPHHHHHHHHHHHYHHQRHGGDWNHSRASVVPNIPSSKHRSRPGWWKAIIVLWDSMKNTGLLHSQVPRKRAPKSVIARDMFFFYTFLEPDFFCVHCTLPPIENAARNGCWSQNFAPYLHPRHLGNHYASKSRRMGC